MAPSSAVQRLTDTALWNNRQKPLLNQGLRPFCVSKHAPTPPLETVQNSIDLHLLVPHLRNLANVIEDVLGIYNWQLFSACCIFFPCFRSCHGSALTASIQFLYNTVNFHLRKLIRGQFIHHD